MEENEKLLRFFQGADVLIHDSQYTAAEYEKHLGWGHTSFEHAINMAHKAGVKKLILFHHDPNRTDEQLAQMEQDYQKRIAGKTAMQVMMAREGMLLEA
jgi:ribonuclease BN (tRNA processing enzyme)